jgi:hypothetical protein
MCRELFAGGGVLAGFGLGGRSVGRGRLSRQSETLVVRLGRVVKMPSAVEGLLLPGCSVTLRSR